jgi:hypothetical protein
MCGAATDVAAPGVMLWICHLWSRVQSAITVFIQPRPDSIARMERSGMVSEYVVRTPDSQSTEQSRGPSWFDLASSVT